MGYFTSPILVIWNIIYIVQVFFAYGTAYRYTKKGGDNGIAFFGWFLAFSLASLVPGLGIYLWHKSKKEENEYSSSTDKNNINL